MVDKNISFSDVEGFILNNKDLANINAYLSRFNPIKVMGMERMEIRHSKILGWLLDPRGNHGLGDEFLRRFLSEALRGEYGQDIKSLDVSNTSLLRTNTYIEWNRIDIFIECPDQEWAFIIENKIHATQTKNQLLKYRKYVEERFIDYQVIGIFLTLEDETPEDERYCQIQYPSVVTILEALLDQKSDSLSEKISNFIKYYLEIVGELTRMNEKQNEMEMLARRVYQDNKDVLEYLFEHGNKDEFENAIETFMNPSGSLEKNSRFLIGDTEYEFLYASKNWYRFIPTSWIETLGPTTPEKHKSNDFKWKGCENWFPYPIVCWIELYGESTIRLQVEVGPLIDHEMRVDLIHAIKKNLDGEKFQKSATEKNKKYSRFFTIKKTIDDTQDVEKMHKIFNQLFEKEFLKAKESIHQALIEFVKKHP